ncbi:MAG: dihydrodipicolinate synthase family protein [Nitrospirae bacterium]|nr:dihydrodipicolinate synthase family protein [Nitrospirota bacterium]
MQGTASAAGEGPILLYNVPAFTTPISTDLALRLFESVPNIIGIKDSSGELETLKAISARPDLDAHAILGHDIVLAEALADIHPFRRQRSRPQRESGGDDRHLHLVAHLAADQGRLHPLGAHGDSVRDGDRVEL